MKIKLFLELISQGFDVSFNYKDELFTISVIDEIKGIKKFGIGSDRGFVADFESLESIPNLILHDKSIAEIVSDLTEEEIYY